MTGPRMQGSSYPTALFQKGESSTFGLPHSSERPSGEGQPAILPVGSVVTVTRPLYQKPARSATRFLAAVQVEEETFKAKVTAAGPDDGEWDARTICECEEIEGSRRARFVYPPITGADGQPTSGIQVEVLRRPDTLPDLSFDVPVDQIVRGRRKEASWRRDRTLDGDEHQQVLLSIGPWSLTYDQQADTTPHRATWKSGRYVAQREDGETRPYHVVADREGNTTSKLYRKRIAVPDFCQEGEFLQAIRQEMTAVEDALRRRVGSAF